MRPERITLQQAQRCYNAIRAQVKLDPRITMLPEIDMNDIFIGRKSMTIASVTKQVCGILNNLS